MMRLDTKSMTPDLRTGRGQADEMPLLIQVPRFDEPHGRAGFWRTRDAGHGRQAWPDSSRTFRPAAGGGSVAESDAPDGRSWSWPRWPARSRWAGPPAAVPRGCPC